MRVKKSKREQEKKSILSTKKNNQFKVINCFAHFGMMRVNSNREENYSLPYHLFLINLSH